MAVQFESTDEAMERLRHLEREIAESLGVKEELENRFVSACLSASRLKREREQTIDYLADNYRIDIEA